MASTLLKDEIDRVLSTLSPRESRIVELHYGLHNGNPLTLQAIGDRFGLTRERIRQIQAASVKKLQHPSRSSMLDLPEE